MHANIRGFMLDTPNNEITKRQGMLLLIVTVGGHALKHAFNAAFAVMLPSIKSDLILNNTQIGILSTFRGIAGGIANIPAGIIGDRFIKRRAEILGGSIMLVSVFAFTLGVSTNFWMAVLAASLFSIAITFWHPAAISSLSKEFSSRRGFAIALHGTGGSIGETIGPILAGSLMSVVSWRIVFQGSIVPGLLFGIIIWSLLRTIPASQPSASITGYVKSVLRILRNTKLLLVLIFAGGFVGGQTTVLTFLPIYLSEEMDANTATIGIYLALAQVGGIASQPIMGFASDKFGRKFILTPSLCLLGLCFIGISIVPSGFPLGLVVLLMGAFLFPLMAILLAAALDLVGGETQAATVSLVFGSATIVSSFTPTVAGKIADYYTNTQPAFLLAAGLILSTALLAGLTNWQSKSHES